MLARLMAVLARMIRMDAGRGGASLKLMISQAALPRVSLWKNPNLKP
jgi:hypothetical protein